MGRNKAIHNGKNNQNYREAERFVAVLTKNITPLTSSLDKIAKRFDVEDTKHSVHREIMFKEITDNNLVENVGRR
jgi:hypothetical protein